MKKLLFFFWKHKVVSFLFLLLIGAGTYVVVRKTGGNQSAPVYVTQAVSRGMLVSSISGSGQVSASKQVSISPKVSGEVKVVKIKTAQSVKKDDVLVEIDSGDSSRKLSEARLSYENAKLELEEFLTSTDELTMLQAENAVADAEASLAKLKLSQTNGRQDLLDSKNRAENDLEKAYEDAYNDIADAFLDFPDIMSGLYTVMYSEEISDSEPSVVENYNNRALIDSFSLNDDDYQYTFMRYVDKAEADYEKAKTSYDINFDDYRSTDRYSDKDDIEALLDESVDMAKKISDTAKSQINMLDWWTNYRTDNDLNIFSKVTSYRSSLTSYTSKINSHLSTLLSAQKSIQDYKDTISDAERSLEEADQNYPLELAASERSLTEKKQKLADLEAGPTDLEIKTKQLSVQQKLNSLIEAQQDYADYFIRAPFDGVVAQVDVVIGDSVNSGTEVAILVTEQKLAEITLNEIDAAQVKVGQRAVLTLDAVPDLSITGEVVEVDGLGTVSSGVVSYGVKIIFDIQDERVKPGMSAGVNIIIESKSDVLLAPLSAVKTDASGNSYVEVMKDNQIARKNVEIGLSNDTMIEIVSGLEEGEEIISQTVSASGNSSSQSSGSFGGPSMGGMFMR